MENTVEKRENDVITCCSCGEETFVEDVFRYDNQRFCHGCFVDFFSRCDCCGDIVKDVEAYEFNGKLYCTKCWL